MKPVVVNNDQPTEWDGTLPFQRTDKGSRATYWELSPADLVRVARSRLIIVLTEPDGTMAVFPSRLIAELDVQR